MTSRSRVHRPLPIASFGPLGFLFRSIPLQRARSSGSVPENYLITPVRDPCVRSLNHKGHYEFPTSGRGAGLIMASGHMGQTGSHSRGIQVTLSFRLSRATSYVSIRLVRFSDLGRRLRRGGKAPVLGYAPPLPSSRGSKSTGAHMVFAPSDLAVADMRACRTFRPLGQLTKRILPTGMRPQTVWPIASCCLEPVTTVRVPSHV